MLLQLIDLRSSRAPIKQNKAIKKKRKENVNLVNLSSFYHDNITIRRNFISSNEYIRRCFEANLRFHRADKIAPLSRRLLLFIGPLKCPLGKWLLPIQRSLRPVFIPVLAMCKFMRWMESEKFVKNSRTDWNTLSSKYTRREGEKKFWLKLVLVWSNGSLIGKVDEYRNLMELLARIFLLRIRIYACIWKTRYFYCELIVR